MKAKTSIGKVINKSSRSLQSQEDKEQLRQVLQMCKAIRNGEFTTKLQPQSDGLVSDVIEVLNDINELNRSFANELIRVGNIVGKEGKMNDRVSIGTVKGSWLTNVESINNLISDLVQPTIEASRVITAVARGDLSQKMVMEIEGSPLKGEFARIGHTVNTMVDQLISFASKVSRVAKDVGTEGKLGGQAEVKGVSGTWKDLTDNLNSMAYENSRLYCLSQEAIEIRNDFLSIASHELNTPITTLKLQLQMVLKGLQLPKDGQFPLERFQNSVNSSIRQVDRLIQLIQVLLDVSRIQTGKFTFAFKDINLKEVVNEVVERHEELIKNSGSTLHVNEVPELMVCWDKMRIEQVLTNLLINAIKYAPGEIELKISEENNLIRIEIADHGPGIEDAKLSSIFHRFERAATSDKVGGLGLGLFIVKEIVEGHQGEITVSSELGKGTTFSVLLPVDPEAVRPARPHVQSPEAHLLT